MVWENSQNGTMCITKCSKILKLGKIMLKTGVTRKHKVRDDMRKRRLMWAILINWNLP